MVAPPSLHLSGRQHCWSVDFDPDDAPLAPIPDWLTASLTAAQQKNTSNRMAQSDCDRRQRGQRNTSLAGLAGHLLRHYVICWSCSNFCSPRMQRGNPPLPHTEITTIANSIARRELARRQAR